MLLKPVSQFAVLFNNSQGFDEFRVGDMFCARPKQFQDFPGLLASHEVSLLPCLTVRLLDERIAQREPSNKSSPAWPSSWLRNGRWLIFQK